MVGDVNGGGYRDLINVFSDQNEASIDVHVVRANHSSAPRSATDPTKWDYAAMFANAYASSIGIADPVTGQNLSLCQLVSRGDALGSCLGFELRSAPTGMDEVREPTRSSGSTRAACAPMSSESAASGAEVHEASSG